MENYNGVPRPYDNDKFSEKKDYDHNQRHEPFQFGTNPLKMTPFERSLVEKEARDRAKLKNDYVKGIQGVDGGKCIYAEGANESY